MKENTKTQEKKGLIKMTNTQKSTRGIGFAGLLTIAFIVLKLCGVISWSWVWVLAPLWIGWSLVLFIVAIVVVAKVIVERWY